MDCPAGNVCIWADQASEAGFFRTAGVLLAVAATGLLVWIGVEIVRKRRRR